jgi:hypothetical protein
MRETVARIFSFTVGIQTLIFCHADLAKNGKFDDPVTFFMITFGGALIGASLFLFRK